MDLFEETRREYEHGIASIAGVARKFGVHRRLVREALGSTIPRQRAVPARLRPWCWRTAAMRSSDHCSARRSKRSSTDSRCSRILLRRARIAPTRRRFVGLAPDLLVLDDFGLYRLSPQYSQDLYELIIERHRRSSFAITSNRGVDEWLGLFDDPILGNSALDRLVNAAHQIVIEGPSYRAKLAPKRREASTSTDRQ